MVYLPFIISNILSAAVSAAVTVYLVRYFILKHRDEFFGLSSGASQLGSNSKSPTKEARKIEVVKNEIIQKTTEETILESFVSTKYKTKFSLSAFCKRIVRTMLKKFWHLIHAAVHFLSISIDALFTYIFEFLGSIFGIILVPVYRLFYKVRSYSPIWSFSSIYERTTYLLSIGRKQSQRDVKEITHVLEEPSKVATSVVEVNLESETETPQEAVVKDSPKVTKSQLHFASEVYLSLLFVVAILFPFAFKIHQIYPHAVLLYCLLLLLLGAYTLLNKESARVFWAIGVSMWVMLSLWYFEGTQEAQLGGVVVFLCAFLSVYAISSFIWYGLRKNQATFIEYGLFVLHPFLYLAGVYLLLVAESKSFVIILCAAVTAFYIYFAEEVKKIGITHKSQTDFIYISYFVALIAVMSLVCVATEGFMTVVIISLASVLYIKFSKKLKTTFLYILLLTLFGQTLGTTNTSSIYTFIANERSISYIMTAFVFVYVINFSRSKKDALWGDIKTFSTIALAFTVFFGATVEILDARANSNIFAKGIPDLALSCIYLMIGAYLFYSGNRDKSLTIKVVAVLFSIYSLYFTTTRLLG